MGRLTPCKCLTVKWNCTCDYGVR